jgi:hypothetical protein
MARTLTLWLVACSLVDTTAQQLTQPNCAFRSTLDLIGDLETCRDNNTEACSGCFDNLSNDIQGINDFSACRDIVNLACPRIKCCEVCEWASSNLFQCTAKSFAQISNTCGEMNCTGFDYGNGGGGDDDGVAANTSDCGACQITDDPYSDSTCTSFEQEFCYGIKCCSVCEASTRAYAQCIVDTKIATYNLSACTLVCDQDLPTQSPADAPAEQQGGFAPTAPSNPPMSSAASAQLIAMKSLISACVGTICFAYV